MLPLHKLWHSNDSSWTESQKHGFDSSIWFLHQKLSANQIVVFQSDSQSANQIPTASQCSDLNAWLEEFYSKIKVGKQENDNRFSNLTKTLYFTIWKINEFWSAKRYYFWIFLFFCIHNFSAKISAFYQLCQVTPQYLFSSANFHSSMQYKFIEEIQNW